MPAAHGRPRRGSRPVSRHRPGLLSPSRRQSIVSAPIRLDLLGNPYGPSVHVHEALTSADELHLPAGARENELRLRLARMVGVPPDWLLLSNGLDELLGMMCLWRRTAGPLIVFPPSDPWEARRAALHGLELVSMQRLPSFALGLGTEAAADVPPDATALVGSPNDPTGTLVGSQEAVRLLRASQLVVIDERHGAYSGRTLVPLVREFDNLVVLQTFETWAGLAGLPMAYAVGPPGLLERLGEYRRSDGVAIGAVLAALATLDDLEYVRATVQRVREEKSRLYRMLRKLNMVRTYPSWANFLLASVERGTAGHFARELARRGIIVHRPPQPELGRFLRVSATRPEHTDALKRALIEIAADL